ncbi:hypothetical protein [Mucilaginibacter sp. OK098]|uniref:hypothetical protein n=1 Tax=Mucilaginibacter sp. OK098 TaxID=1855297 RepID=UPI000913E94A|nr:hypothetical protein [Mucilaginibacter sp. OK098]SHL98825.1 hypothetical protein SAMN05216524_101429 [Mucilaginibacter sp. OK098]
MKRLLLLIITIMVICAVRPLHAQTPTKAQAEEMARRIRTMTPAQMMKFRDSMVKAMTQQQARALPNGDQLLIQHHYDTTYTTVSFNYSKKVSESHTNGGTSGSSTYLCYGRSAKAPMIYEANGHTIVQCALNPPGANTSQLDNMAKNINRDKKYMTPDQAVKGTDLARQMSFSSMTTNDNSLTGTASENSLYNGNGSNTIITTKPPLIKMGFSFVYDPVQVVSTVGVGASINIRTVGHDEHGNSYSSDGTTDVGMGATTDPQYAKIVGGGTPQRNPNDVYITVTKTTRGFKVQYSKVQHIRESNADITETLTADIGEPLQDYEAVLKPMPESKYEKWLPKGPNVDGSDDTKGDDSLRFYVVVRDKFDTTKSYAGNYTVKYKLKDITHYKGFNSNYPLEKADQKPDFKIASAVRTFANGVFDPRSLTDSTAASQPNKGAAAIVQLTCMDYGAWARLTAEVTLDNGQVVQARPYYEPIDTGITVPFDRDKNKIADAWEKYEHILNQGYNLTWDKDVRPDNGHPGDNIPLIDEYRGFLTEDNNYKPVFKRLSPQVKELFTVGLADKSGYGTTYKAAIRAGAFGYAKVTKVQVYHFTDSKYGHHEPGQPSVVTYGRWINFNSPTDVRTCGVVIYADDNPNPDTDPASVKALATTFPIFDISRAGYHGGQVPNETKEIHLWTYYVTRGVPFKPTEFLPDHPGGNDAYAQRMSANIRAANAEFHVNIDPNHASPIVAQYLEVNIARIITFTVAHELCHATNIHHHHVADANTDDLAFFKGVSTCPVRYWMDNHYTVNCMTWQQMWIFGLWDPGQMTTPWGPGDVMSLCTHGDDCFHQMELKKN